MADLIMSPSLYKEWKGCNRKALINSYRFLGNIHTVYGRAYEYGARLIVDMLQEYQEGKGLAWDIVESGEYDECEKADRLREYVIGYAILESSKYLIKFNLSPHKEKNVFTLATGLAHTYAFFEEFLTRHKVEEYEERMIFKGANFTIGGAYDLRARDSLSNTSCLYDFKGITSLWNYSFPSSPQLPIYTVLKQMTFLAYGSDEVMSMNGGYLINMTSAKQEEEPFIYVPVNTKLVLANLDGMMNDFIESGKQLHRLQTTTKGLCMQYTEANVGLENCSKGFNCFQLTECEKNSFSLETYPDDRVFANLQEIDFSQSLMLSAIKKIRENSTDVNLVDGDGVGKGNMFTGEQIESFYDVDELSLNEL